MALRELPLKKCPQELLSKSFSAPSLIEVLIHSSTSYRKQNLIRNSFIIKFCTHHLTIFFSKCQNCKSCQALLLNSIAELQQPTHQTPVMPCALENENCIFKWVWG